LIIWATWGGESTCRKLPVVTGGGVVMADCLSSAQGGCGRSRHRGAVVLPRAAGTGPKDRHDPAATLRQPSHRPGVDRRFPRYPGLAASRRTSPEPLASRRREAPGFGYRLPPASRRNGIEARVTL
jgi:hypothetical protein